MKPLEFVFMWVVVQIIDRILNHAENLEKTVGIIGALEEINVTLLVGIFFMIWAIQDKK